MNTIAQRERLLLAPYAMRSADTAGRRYAEPEHQYRGPFQRDRDRIVHSAAYRRLSYKTQVFTNVKGDYHRTRLTHTLEVASIARTLARALALNEDLVEALALVHDIGHPPFGHAGEDTLNERLAGEGGFNHNQQALRTVELLESRYAEFPGLNLSQEVLAGQRTRVKKDRRTESPLLEVQLVDAADSIAYDTHDADDALESGLIRLEELLELSLWREAAQRVVDRHGAIAGDDLRRAVLHELIDWQVGDLIEQITAQIAEHSIQTTADVRAAPSLIAPVDQLKRQKAELESFLHREVYRHPLVMQQRGGAKAALEEMFAWFSAHPHTLPPKFQHRAALDGPVRATADYLAGMTDRYALEEHRRLEGG
jgi:dGTPase